MRGERIITRQFEKINILKKELVSRGLRDSREIIKDIKAATEDLEAVLLDLGYLSDDQEENIEVNNDFRTYRCFRDEAVFTMKDLEKYNGKEGMPLYVAVGNIVYDFSDLVEERIYMDIEEKINEIINNKELLSNYVIVGKIVNN